MQDEIFLGQFTFNEYDVIETDKNFKVVSSSQPQNAINYNFTKQLTK